MATIKFQLRSKANKAVPIYFSFSMGRGVFFRVRTGFSIHPSDWSDAKGFPKQNDAANKDLTGNLKKLENHILDSINQAQAKGEEITKDFLEMERDNCFNRVERDDTTLVTYQIQYVIDNAQIKKVSNRSKIGLSSNTIKNLRSFLNNFIDFEKHINKRLRFTDLSSNNVEKFKSWLFEVKDFSENYAGDHMKKLKGLAYEMEKKGVEVHPFARHIETFQEADEDRNFVTLDFDELKKIENNKLEREALQNARKWFLIGCELGQRGEDLLRIDFAQIRTIEGGRVIDVFQSKGKKWVTVPLSPRAEKFLEMGVPYKITSQNLNAYIKEIAELTGLDEIVEGSKFITELKRKKKGNYPKHELIASHACRRSYATNYYKKIPTPILMEVTGHKKESTFLKYINKVKDKDENATLFFKYLKLLEME